MSAKARKARRIRRWQRRFLNPTARSLIKSGLLSTHAILETRGRMSGRPHQTPVGNGLRGDTFWVVAEHGYYADYVRNIEQDSHVRVFVRGHWRRGTAHILREDDPKARLRKMGRFVNAAGVRAMGTDLLSVRIDLEHG